MASIYPIKCAAAVLCLAAMFCAVADAQEKTQTSKAAQSDSRPGGEPAAMARGRLLFLDRCAICHHPESDAMKAGPGLKGIYKRGKFANGVKVDNASMEKRIVNGGKDMPPFGAALNPAQVLDLISYLKTL